MNMRRLSMDELEPGNCAPKSLSRNAKRSLLLAILLYALQPWTACGTIITFEDHPSDGLFPISGAYQMLNWNNFYAYDINLEPFSSGFNAAVHSGSRFAFSGGGGDASIRGGLFNLNAAYISAAWRDNLVLSTRGFLNGTLTYSNSYTLSATSATLINFNYLAVDTVTFSTSGGTQHPGYPGDGTNIGLDDLDVTILKTVIVSAQPVNQTNAAGDSATFNVVAGGTSPFTYQWLFKGTDIIGATNSSLVLTNVQSNDEGAYGAVVASLYDSVVSSNATLSVLPSPPRIATQASSQSVVANSTVIVLATIYGSSPIAVQWLFNGAIIDSATNMLLTLTNVQTSAEGNYSLRASNLYGTTNTAPFFLDVVDFAQALDATNLSWSVGGDTPWFIQLGAGRDGSAAVQSGVINDGQQSILQTTTSGPGVLSFWWRTVSDPGNAFLRCSVNDVEQTRISGVTGWLFQTIYIGVGSQTIQWAYVKSNAIPYSADAAWLDQVNFISGSTPPLIALNPFNQVVLLGADATLAAAALGTPPLSYQWQLNTTNLDGATNDTLVVGNAGLAAEGTYTLMVSNAFGFTNSGKAFLNVVDAAEALGGTNLAWSSGGNSPWSPETSVTHDAVAAMRSGGIGPNQQSTLQIIVNGPGTLSFWWKVSSEPNNDYLNYSLDGTEQSRISGAVDWQQKTLYLGPGSHTLSWSYSKNAAGNSGADSAWLDQVSYTEGGTAAFVASNPANQVASRSANATFSVLAQGSPPFSFQWLFNGNYIPGATNAVLTVTNVQVADTGAYAVAVSNIYGGMLSGNARLSLLNVVAWGAGKSNTFTFPDWGQSIVPTNLGGVIGIAAGAYHSLALQADGKVIAWGYNSYGQANVPSTMTNAIALAAGMNHSLALLRDGTMSAWGNNFYGQASVPVMNVVAIAAGWHHNLALTPYGWVWAWGAGNSQGQLPHAGQSIVPYDLREAVAIAAGGLHSLALRSNGTVVAWGSNGAGQSTVPAGLVDVVAIAAGSSNSVALQRDGTVVVWGDNSYGQRNVPPGLNNVASISAGDGHILALKNDGTLISWGLNVDGQTNIPAGLTNVFAISAGGYHALALVNTGPPTLLRQPYNQSVFLGATVTLTAPFLGAEPIRCQWLHAGAQMPGRTNGALPIAGVQFSDAGNYQLTLSNAYGAVTSAVAVLTVHDTAPSFLTQPASQSVLPGSNALFSATTDGMPPFTYQWYLNGVAILRATNAALTLLSAKLTDTGNYSLLVSNAFGTVTSSNALLTVIDLAQALNATNLVWLTSNNPAWFPEQTVTHDGVAAACSGTLRYTNQSALWTTVVGPGTLSFWWQASLPSVASLSFSIDGLEQRKLAYSTPWEQRTFYLGNGNHTLRWSPSWSLSSSYYALTGWVDQVSYSIGPSPPLILSRTADAITPAGKNVTLSATTGGTPPLNYQWSCNGTNLAGVTGNSLSLNNLQQVNSGVYTLTVSNAYGVTNTIFALTVIPAAPWISVQPADQRAVPGGNCVFSASGLGSEPLTYQWQFNGQNLSQATASSLVLSSLSSNQLGAYRLSVSNAYGMVTSSNANLTFVASSLIGWGDNFFGQITVPPSLSNVTTFAGGWDYSVAVDGDGNVLNWGFPETSFSPNPPGVIALAAGWTHMLALKTDGTVVAAGATVPVGVSNVVAIAAGYQFSLALKQDGTVVAWASSASSVTNLPPGLTNVVGIACGDQHALALKRDGSVVAWGQDFAGSTVVPGGLTDVAAISAGWYHSLALKHDGTVVAWGYNLYGQTNVPATLSNVVAVAGGYMHSLALKRDGTLVAWGSNLQGQTNIPVVATNAVAIASGEGHCLALLKPPSLSVLRQPRNQSVLSGMKAIFSIGVVGVEPIQFQWRRNGSEIPGATQSKLTFGAASAADAGTYDVVATNAYGAITSAVATLSLQMVYPVVRAPSVDPASHKFGFDVLAVSSSIVVIEAATNFVDWIPIQTNTVANGQFRFTAPLSESWPNRFYRARFIYGSGASDIVIPRRE
jgi:alpha-tubulin suppressor-like RCC1 family protein